MPGTIPSSYSGATKKKGYADIASIDEEIVLHVTVICEIEFAKISSSGQVEHKENDFPSLKEDRKDTDL